MKKLPVLLLWTSCFISCKKQINMPPNNNEVKATVVVSPTSTITINAKGLKAPMGPGFLGIGTFISGTNETGASVYINVHGPGISSIANPGTYSYTCEYRTNASGANAAIYSNSGTNSGSITFTTINENFMEGYFNAVCRCWSPGCVFGVDSVIVTGTFKGDYLR
jgi:hypothetical protein